MRVYTANFGRGNQDWPQCVDESILLTRASAEEYRLWASGDRDGFVRHVMDNTKTVRGVAPIKPVASRWFQLLTIISETHGEIWLHREKEQLWWTKSKTEIAIVKPEALNNGSSGSGVVLKKACEPWSKLDSRGATLVWGALHPKARHFLFMEATLVALKPENASYAMALLAGEPLDRWHDTPQWKSVQANSRKRGGKTYDARERTMFRMAWTAMQTVKNSNGQLVERLLKDKQLGFQNAEAFIAYVSELFAMQEGLCAVTNITLELDMEQTDTELSCSLDRIDSARGYEEGNLQIVCKFINRWKSSSDDGEFRRLIGLINNA